jgi:hypothetical protein
MKASWCVTMVLALGLVMPSSAAAQWPLGRELPPMPVKDEGTHVLASGTGRFQIFVSPNIKGHSFMLDTETGRVWIMKKDATTGEFSLQRIPVEQVDGQKAGRPGADKTKGEGKKTPEQE